MVLKVHQNDTNGTQEGCSSGLALVIMRVKGCKAMRTTIEAISFDDVSLGNTCKIQRVCRLQTQQEIADIAGVSQKDVELLESNQRLPLIIKRKLLRAYDLIK